MADPILQGAEVADLVTDVWRIGRRARRDRASDAVLVACERAMDRLVSRGLRVEELEGMEYAPQLNVSVVHAEGGPSNRRISECLSPAVYFHDELIKRAEVVIQGEKADGTTDS
jgi:hypothetical protein